MKRNQLYLTLGVGLGILAVIASSYGLLRADMPVDEVEFTATDQVFNSPGSAFDLTVHVSQPLALGQPFEVEVLTTAHFDAPATTLSLMLPEGVSLINGSTSLTQDLAAQETMTLAVEVQIEQALEFPITATVIRELGQGTTWQNMQTVYVLMLPDGRGSVSYLPADVMESLMNGEDGIDDLAQPVP